MQVKAQGLLNAAKWIEDEYGRDALGTVIRACSEPVRERYTSAIAINWHPMEELVELVEKADAILGNGNGKLADAIGAAGARANMKGVVVRIASYIAKPEFLFRRVAGLWRQFNDEGEMLVHGVDEHHCSIELKDVTTPNATFCVILTGWVREIALSIGIQSPTVRHAECRARGDQRCMWAVRWTAIQDVDKAAQVAQDSISRLPGRPASIAPASAPTSSSSARMQASSAARTASSGRHAAVRPASTGGPTSSRSSASSEKEPAAGGREPAAGGKPPPRGEGDGE